jgi:hypothetical protein
VYVNVYETQDQVDEMEFAVSATRGSTVGSFEKSALIPFSCVKGAADIGSKSDLPIHHIF